MFNDVYKNRRVFLTGHTGFKGAWLLRWLESLGAEVTGYALPPNTTPSLFGELHPQGHARSVLGDILDAEKLEGVVRAFQPDIVFHLAAQPLVRASYRDPVGTYRTNVIGSLHVLEAARKAGSVRAFVNVTTDKCYENREVRRGYREDEPMGGHDMYSSSKGCVEILSASYRRSFLQDGFALATARSGNVIGGGDWAEDRLIPDIVRAVQAGQVVDIRSPDAVRPWQHVLDPLSGYLLLGQALLEKGRGFAEAFNFGPREESVRTVAEVVASALKHYGQGHMRIHKTDDLHEAGLLMLNVEKAEKVLGWTPTYAPETAVAQTMEWYRRFYAGEGADALTRAQIADFEKAMAHGQPPAKK